MNKGWSFNGNYDLPTFKPSILVRGHKALDPNDLSKGRRETVCHSFVTDGKIRFLNDCTHALAGQTVDLPEEFNVDFEP